MIEYGKNYRDIVTGFEGICIGSAEWLYGCTQYMIQPKGSETYKKEHYGMFFEKQLELISPSAVAENCANCAG